jgi:NAD(P)-dependent dehydrogenase (short-subunit alcohol dehydrogenase family)
MELLKDKVVIVTGAAVGIGAGVAKLFTERGAHVFLADLDGEGVRKTAADLQAGGGSAFAFEANAGSRDAMANVVDDAVKRFGRIDGLINNAGIYPRHPFLEMTEEQWDTMQNINMKSVFHCTKLVMPHMVRQRSGTVVNIASARDRVGTARRCRGARAGTGCRCFGDGFLGRRTCAAESCIAGGCNAATQHQRYLCRASQLDRRHR